MEDAGIYARESAVLGRYVQLGIAQDRVLSVEFPEKPDQDSQESHELLDRIADYLDGETDGFRDVSVAMTMPTDEREVLEKVREVPYGEDASVRQITTMVPGKDPDNESDQQTVREALGTNPAPIFIPTHRVRDGRSCCPRAVEQTLRSIEGL